jgi:hypothetical protein
MAAGSYLDEGGWRARTLRRKSGPHRDRLRPPRRSAGLVDHMSVTIGKSRREDHDHHPGGVDVSADDLAPALASPAA